MFVLMFIGVASFGIATFRAKSSRAPTSSAPPSRTQIGGKWSATVRDQLGHVYRIGFTLDVLNDKLLGTVVYPTGEGGILHGKIHGDTISFITRHIPQGETEPATIHFEGRTSGDEIHFVMQSPTGHARYVATRATP